MFSNFTEETCTGTGATLALAGATTGKVAFSETYADGDPVAYALEDSGGTILIAGVGAYVSATDDITRNDLWNWNGTVVDEDPSTNITLSGGTHTVRCDVFGKLLPNYFQQAADGTSFYFPHNIVRYDQEGAAGGSEFDATSGRFLLTPIHFVYPVKMTSIGSQVTTVSAGGNFRVALYTATFDGDLGVLIVDSGDLSTATAVAVFATLTNPLYLAPGAYFMAAAVDNTTARFQGIRMTESTATGPVVQGINTGGDVLQKFFNQTYGAFPSTLGTPDGTNAFAQPGLIYK